MKLLLTIKEQDINASAPIINARNFETREASRAVVLDENNKVYLLKVNLHNYHKLPGGGIDAGEDILTALKRELLEETGCQAKVISELGKIVEFRDRFKLKQTSYCFLAKQIGPQKASALVASEIAEGFEEVKAKNIDEAIVLLEHDKPDNYEGEFIVMRDLAILKAAKRQIINFGAEKK